MVIAVVHVRSHHTAHMSVSLHGACADEELVSILRGKLRREQLTAGVNALMAAADVLRKKRATASHFGNGGEVANLLSEAKLRKENRRGSGSVESRRAIRSSLTTPNMRR